MAGPVRVEPLAKDQRSQRQQELVDEAGGELGVFTTLVHHVDLFADFLPLGGRLLRRSSLDAVDRELLILRTAAQCGASYEWSHHDPIGRRAGLNDDVIPLLADLEGTNGLRPHEARLARAADELVTEHRLSDQTWEELRQDYEQNQVMEICMLVGSYTMLAGTLNSLGVAVEPGYPVAPWERA